MRKGLLITPTSQVRKLRFRKSRIFPQGLTAGRGRARAPADSEARDISLFMTELPFPRGKEKWPDRGEPGPWAASPAFFLLYHLFSRYLKGVKSRRVNTHSQRKRKPRRPPSGAVPPLPPAAASPCQLRLPVTTVIGRLNSWRGAGLLAPSRQGGQGLSKPGLGCYLPHQPQQHLATFFKHPARA